jgi:putative nucleotidyltransferase with HDIG domain
MPAINTAGDRAPFFNRTVEFERRLARLLGARLLTHPSLLRLKEVRFLGSFEYAFIVPKRLRYTRYDHTLAVAILTQQYCSNLGLTEAERDLATLAALLHDINHAPFSHSSEAFLRQQGFASHDALGDAILVPLLSEVRPTLPGSLRSHRSLSDLARDIRSTLKGQSPMRSLRPLFANPLCPDTVDGILRARHSLGQSSFLSHGRSLPLCEPERLLAAISRHGIPLGTGTPEGADEKRQVHDFFDLTARLYNQVFYSPEYLAVEAMFVRALELARAASADPRFDRFPELVDREVIDLLMQRAPSADLWHKILTRRLFRPLSQMAPELFREIRYTYTQTVSGRHHPYQVNTAIETEVARLLGVAVECVICHVSERLRWTRDGVYLQGRLFDEVIRPGWEFRWSASQGTWDKWNAAVFEIFVYTPPQPKRAPEPGGSSE